MVRSPSDCVGQAISLVARTFQPSAFAAILTPVPLAASHMGRDLAAISGRDGSLLALAAALASGVVVALWRLATERRRTARLQWSDDLPATVLVLDLTALEAAFAELRGRAVTDCVAYLGGRPDEVARLARLVKVRHASDSALRDLGVRNAAELQDRLGRLDRAPHADALRFLIESVWAGRELVENEYSYLQDGGGERTCLMRARIPGGGRDWSAIVFMLVDLTTSMTRAGGRMESQELVQRTLGQANILVWWAKVRREGDRLHWKVHVPGRTDGCELYKLARAVERGGLWNSGDTLDSEEMEVTSRRAILGGRRRYQHEFRVQGPDRLHWLAEDVAIQRLGDDEWSLMGVVTDVSARHEADDALRRSEALIRQILERADCMLWQGRVSAKPDGGFDWACDAPLSQLLRRLFGRSEPIKDGLIYRESAEFPDKAEIDRLSGQALREGWPGFEQTIRIVREGKTYWLHEQVSIRRIAPGVWDLIGVAIDVTDRHLAEEDRRASDARLRQILGQIDCLIWQADVAGSPEQALAWTMYVPPSNLYRKIFDRDPLNNGEAELWSVVQVPEMAEMNARARDAMRMGLSSYEQEFRVMGSRRTFRLHETVSIRRVGPAAWKAAGIVTDITDRWEAERALAEEKERLAVTLEAMEEAVVNADGEGRIVFFNRSASRLLGRLPGQLMGKPFDTVFHWVNPRGEGLAGISFKEAAACTRPLELPDNTALKTDHSGVLPVEGCFAPMRSSDGRTSGVVLVVRDVSERQRLEGEMLRASKLESVGLLAGGIAHDFNNILTAILANLSLALVDAALEDEVLRSLREAERAAMRARELTQQLLTFAKGGDPVRTAVQLSDILVEIAEFALRGSSVKCEFELDPGLWLAHADRGQLGQVVQNLVINAAQAMRSGTIRIRAGNELVESGSAEALQPGPYVWIEVDDNGPGISPENLSKIFDPYFTTKSNGSGLGLATVYAVVRRHGGAVEVKSELGRGACFRIRLPANPAANAPARESKPKPAPANLAGRVLVMDDEEAIRKVAEKMLRRLGLDVEVSCDGAEAIECVARALGRGRPFDCVILDLTVPGGMGGEQALLEMRKIMPGIRAIVSSGYSDSNILARPGDIHAQGVVAKPYSMEDFARVLEKVLKGEAPC